MQAVEGYGLELQEQMSGTMVADRVESVRGLCR